MTNNMTRNLALSFLLLLLAAASVILLGVPESARSEQGEAALSGYAWSDTVGWISMEGPGYGLSIGDDGTLSGYAWSDAIGWISAYSDDLVDCPSAPCEARVEGTTLVGWLRALAGNTEESGGWDGFISLGDYNVADEHSYGVSLSEGGFSGYAWGDMNMGWIDFSYASTEYAGACADTQGYFCDGITSKHRDAYCAETVVQTCSYLCATDVGLCVPTPSPNGTLRINPRLVTPGKVVKVSWEIVDAENCTVTEDNPAINDSWMGLSSQEAACTHQGGSCVSSPIEAMTTYTLSCYGSGSPAPQFTQEAVVGMVPGWSEL